MSQAPPHPLSELPQPQGHKTFEPGHHPGHEHPDFLAHHWETPKQQFEAGKLGMWLFLATEILLFGGLFCGYAVWRANHPELFEYGSQFLDTTMGAINTVVLILSSLTMAWAVTAAQKNQIGLVKLLLVLTLAGAFTFMVIKYFEYTHKFHEGWYPGIRFYETPGPLAHEFWHVDTQTTHAAAAATAAAAPSDTPSDAQQLLVTPPALAATPPTDAPAVAPASQGPSGLRPDAPLVQQPRTLIREAPENIVHPLRDPERPPNAHMFFNIYFMMTGLHGIHVTIGIGLITWLLIRTQLGHFSSAYFTPIDLVGLYWHIVDLIWIFLFPLFYLI